MISLEPVEKKMAAVCLSAGGRCRNAAFHFIHYFCRCYTVAISRRRHRQSCSLRFGLARLCAASSCAQCAVAAGSQSPVITPLMRVQRHLALTGCITSPRPCSAFNQTFIFCLRPSIAAAAAAAAVCTICLRKICKVPVRTSTVVSLIKF